MVRPDRLPWQDGLRQFGTAQGRAPLTIRAYVQDAGLFLRWCSERSLRAQAARRTDILSWLEWYRGRASQASLVRRFASIRFYYRWLQTEGARRDDPTDNIRLRHPSPPPKRPFSDDELRRILGACRRQRDRALVLVLLDTGLRLGEAERLRLGDIDWSRGLLRIHGKGGKERLVVLGQRSLGALQLCMDGRAYPWYSQRLHGSMTRDGIYRLMRRLSAATGLHVHPHRFRTTWACMFLDASGGDVQAAQVLMGHSKVETTLRYAAWTRERRALEQGRRHSLGDRL